MNIYGFSKQSYASLKEAAYEAAQRIYSPGLMFRDGVIGPGGNNVMADCAARAFTPADLEELRATGEPLYQGLAEMIALRQNYMNGAENGRDCLKEIYKIGQDLEGFKAPQVWSVGNSSFRPTAP